jgi:hypothetical protein
MQDESGHTTQSNRVVILNKTTGFDIINIAPAIVTSSAVLNVTAAKKMQVTVVVTDATGRVLQKNSYPLVAGSNQLKINTSALAAGVYQLAVYAGDGAVRTTRFVNL